MDVNDAIMAGKEKNKAGVGRKYQRRTVRDLSTSNVIGLYTSAFKEAGYGQHPMILQVTVNMVHGFVRACRVNDLDPQTVYGLIKESINRWPEIRRMEHSKNGRPILLAPRPVITEFLKYRESIVGAINELAERAMEGQAPKPTTPVAYVKPEKLAPNQADLDAEYELLQDEG